MDIIAWIDTFWSFRAHIYISNDLIIKPRNKCITASLLYFSSQLGVCTTVYPEIVWIQIRCVKFRFSITFYPGETHMFWKSFIGSSVEMQKMRRPQPWYPTWCHEYMGPSTRRLSQHFVAIASNDKFRSSISVVCKGGALYKTTRAKQGYRSWVWDWEFFEATLNSSPTLT